MLAVAPPTLDHSYLHAAASMQNNIVGVARGQGWSKWMLLSVSRRSQIVAAQNPAIQ